MKKIALILLSTFSLACNGADGVAGPTGPVGPTGPAGQDAIVDYNTIYQTVGEKLPIMVQEAVAKEPALNMDTVISRVIPLLPAGEKGEKGDPGVDGRDGKDGINGKDGVGANGVWNGDFIINGRLCIGDVGTQTQCKTNDGNQIQLFGQAGSGLSLWANLNGQWYQSPSAGYGQLSLAPDLGLRLIQNQRWTPDGVHIPHIVANYPQAVAGFDSQGDWSFNSQATGEPDLGTQKLVLRTDYSSKQVYWALWAPGWTLGVRSSSSECKWCENLRYTIPTQ